MCTEDEGRQATGGPLVLCKQSGECPLAGVFYQRLGAPEEAARGGQEREETLHNARVSSALVGRGGPECCRVTKRQCGLVTVRGKHMATNGAVMGGEETWERLVQESWHINSGGVTSPLAGGQGHSFTLPREVPAPRAQARVRRLEGKCPAGPRRGERSLHTPAPQSRLGFASQVHSGGVR